MEPLKNGTGLTNGSGYHNGIDLTSFDWKLVGKRQLVRIKKVKIGMFKRLIRWLM